MSSQLVPMSVAVLGFIWVSAAHAAPERSDADRKTDALAEEAVKQFDKAFVAKDVDGVLAVSDAPFYWDPEETTVDRERLRNLLVKLFRENDYAGAKFTRVETTTYGELAPRLNKKQKDALDRVAEPKDRVVIIKDAASGSEARTGTLVRVRDGKGKVIGTFSH